MVNKPNTGTICKSCLQTKQELKQELKNELKQERKQEMEEMRRELEKLKELFPVIIKDHVKPSCIILEGTDIPVPVSTSQIEKNVEKADDDDTTTSNSAEISNQDVQEVPVALTTEKLTQQCLVQKLALLQIQLDNSMADFKRYRGSQELSMQRLQVENQVLTDEVDSLQQYGRRETVELHNIPMEAAPTGNSENTLQVVLNFFFYNMGINLHFKDISVAHRVIINDDNLLCPIIYVKFISRNLKNWIMSQKFRLQGQTNGYGSRFLLKENLTPFRRVLLERIKGKLISFRYVWTTEGNIFARKTDQSRKLKINTSAKLEEVLISIVCENQNNRFVNKDSAYVIYRYIVYPYIVPVYFTVISVTFSSYITEIDLV